MIFYFFDFADEKSLDPATVLNSLIKQLLELTNLDNFDKNLAISLEKTYTKGSFQARKTDLTQLALHLEDLCNMFSRLFIVIDGLDECARNDRQCLLTALKSVLEAVRFPVESKCAIKLLLASRPEVNIKYEPGSIVVQTIHLADKEEHSQLDMNFFVQSRLEPHFIMLNLLPSHEDLLTELVTKLGLEAQGM